MPEGVICNEDILSVIDGINHQLVALIAKELDTLHSINSVGWGTNYYEDFFKNLDLMYVSEMDPTKHDAEIMKRIAKFESILEKHPEWREWNYDLKPLETMVRCLSDMNSIRGRIANLQPMGKKQFYSALSTFSKTFSSNDNAKPGYKELHRLISPMTTLNEFIGRLFNKAFKTEEKTC